VTELSAEDAKLITLARGARGRIGAAEGAAVRDELGRTYSGATVASAGLALSAMQLAVAQAVASGAKQLEAAALVADASALSDADAACLRGVCDGVLPVHLVAMDGTVRGTLDLGPA
jgi:hypothetical protein